MAGVARALALSIALVAGCIGTPEVSPQFNPGPLDERLRFEIWASRPTVNGRPSLEVHARFTNLSRAPIRVLRPTPLGLEEQKPALYQLEGMLRDNSALERTNPMYGCDETVWLRPNDLVTIAPGASVTFDSAALGWLNWIPPLDAPDAGTVRIRGTYVARPPTVEPEWESGRSSLDAERSVPASLIEFLGLLDQGEVHSNWLTVGPK